MSTMRMRFFLMGALALLFTFELEAVPARPGYHVYTQPDGSSLTLRLQGDEYVHWYSDVQGQVYLQDEDGYYRKATLPLASALQRGRDRRMASAALRMSDRGLRRDPIAVGQKHFLVILIAFSDLSFTVQNPTEAFHNLLNQPGYAEQGATGSARDFYYDNSQGVFEPVFDVYGPVTLSRNYSYYGKNDSSSGGDQRPYQALVDAVNLLDDEIDFSQYDNDGDGEVDMVFFYYAGHNEAEGGGANTIWPHQWYLRDGAGVTLRKDRTVINKYACSSELKGASGSTMCSIGTACHEFGHAMGLPDMYDIDYDENGLSGGLYEFSTMCSGSYNNDSRTPPYFNSVERNMLGWTEEASMLNRSGDYTLNGIQNNQAYRYETSQEGEYFILECRDGSGWDAPLPSGMLVYHQDRSSRMIDIGYYSVRASQLWDQWESYNYINGNGSHPCFYVVPAADPTQLNYPIYSYSDYSAMVFPGTHRISTFQARDWNGKESDISLTQISFSGRQVRFHAQSASEQEEDLSLTDMGFHYIVSPSRDSYQLLLAETDLPSSFVWLIDGEVYEQGTPEGTIAPSLRRGSHQISVELQYADGRVERIDWNRDIR